MTDTLTKFRNDVVSGDKLYKVVYQSGTVFYTERCISIRNCVLTQKVVYRMIEFVQIRLLYLQSV